MFFFLLLVENFCADARPRHHRRRRLRYGNLYGNIVQIVPVYMIYSRSAGGTK